MGTERFTLHRPGNHRAGHNVNYIAGEMISEEGVSRISLSMVGRDFEGEITLAYDGSKIIVFIKDSEEASHVIHMYPKTEE
jgi:hypothetical protein